MKYIIMCASNDKPIRHLSKIYGETLIERTARMIFELTGEKPIISVSKHLEGFVKEKGFKYIVNDSETRFWCDCFIPTGEPTTYLFGDVVFTEGAIRKIVETETDDIMFFASAKPLPKNYPKRWAEPFAFKVQNQEHLKQALKEIFDLHFKQRAFKRNPIAWEFWQVVRGTPLNVIDYTNYVAINDGTCDIDEPEDIYFYEGGQPYYVGGDL